MKTVRFLFSVFLSLIGLCPCLAKTYEVTHLAGDDSVGSLRWAVNLANARQLDEGNPHLIEFQTGLEGKIELQARVEVTRDLILAGPGADRITLVSPEHDRAIYVNAVARFSVTGLRFTRYGFSAHSTGNGGILANVGEMVVRYCVFDDCEAERGGAIQCGANDLFISDSTFINCVAENEGGAIFFWAGGEPRGIAAGNVTFSKCRARHGKIIWSNGPLLECSHLTLMGSEGSPLIHLEPSPGGQSLQIFNSVAELANRHQEVFNQDPGITVTQSGNVFAVKPRLRPLTWYRRSAAPSILPVPYCMPELDSPVIDAGTESVGTLSFETPLDVRGASRFAKPDAGAVELRSLEAQDELSLASAINLSNAASNDPIDFIALTSDLVLGAPLPELTGQVIITGQDGTDGLIKISGGDLVRPFTVETGARVEFENLRLEDGRSTAGGAILNRGFARVKRCWLTTNQAGCGGAIRSEGGGELLIEACTFSNNVATSDSGAIEVFGGTARLENCSFSKNSANRGGALGFFNTESWVIHCSFSENSATLEGGAIRIAPDAEVTTYGNAFAPHTPSEIANLGIENASQNVIATPGEPTFDFYPHDWLPFPALYPELDSPFWNATWGSGGHDQTGRLGFDFFRDAGAIEYQTVHPYLSVLSTFTPTENAPSITLPNPGGDHIDPLGDIDGDGESNYFEIYYRGDPYDPDRQAEIRFGLYEENGNLRPSFFFQIDGRLDQSTGLNLTRSADLENWTPIGASYASVFEDYHKNIRLMDSDTTDVSSMPKAFYRLGIYQRSLPALFMHLNPVEVPGNVPDGGGLGQVDYRFGMSPYETSNEQYVRFLNAADYSGANDYNLYDPRMSSETWGGIMVDLSRPYGERYYARSERWHFPVSYVDYLSTLRFCNWLHHGAPSQVSSRPTTLDDGAYTITDPGNLDGVTRNPDARYFLPTHDEWIKGGYFNPAPITIGGSVYYDYPVQSNSVNNLAAPGDSESANYAGPGFVIPNLRKTGSYTARSSWSLYDMGGNIAEMIEHSPANNSSGTTWAKGGSFLSTTNDDLIRNRVHDVSFSQKSAFVGFRIAGRP